MGKFSYAGISLVGAIPGGFLLYLLVMVFLNYTEGMKTPFLVLAGLAAACAAAITFLPILILIFASDPEPRKDSFSSGDDETSAAPAGAAAAGGAVSASDFVAPDLDNIGGDDDDFGAPAGDDLEEFDEGGDFSFDDDEFK